MLREFRRNWQIAEKSGLAPFECFLYALPWSAIFSVLIVVVVVLCITLFQLYMLGGKPQ